MAALIIDSVLLSGQVHMLLSSNRCCINQEEIGQGRWRIICQRTLLLKTMMCKYSYESINKVLIDANSSIIYRPTKYYIFLRVLVL